MLLLYFKENETFKVIMYNIEVRSLGLKVN